LEILAFTEREVPNDVLVSHRPGVLLENKEMVIGTSSTRRVAMLTRYFPKVKTVPVRGNLQTRIRKMEEGQCDALLLAYAGVFRMGFKDLIRQVLDTSVFTPAVGQGSLAIETSTSLPAELKSRIKAALNHEQTSHVLEAERAFLRTMEGGCSVPVFGFGRIENKVLHLQGGIISLDGSEEIREEVSIGLEGQGIENIRKAGSDLANFLLNRGGDKILEKIKQNLHPEKPLNE
jgi:hydroxymethylbilane synthase